MVAGRRILRVARLRQRRLAAGGAVLRRTRRHRRDAQLGSGDGHAQPGARRRHHQRRPGNPDRHLVAAGRAGSRSALRPFLDTAQVLPQFVYLVPVVFLFRVGRIPGIIAAVIYALPPGIRLVSLGLKEVSFAPREAAISFGATPRQELFKVQLPLAFKSIMLGINQVILMVLATVIIAGLIGGGALGLEALGGFTKPNLKMGDGVAAGVSIVLLAMILDRLTQAWGNRSAPENRTS